MAKKERMKKFNIFDQNLELTPLEKCQIFDFYNLEWIVLDRERRQTLSRSLFCLKKRRWRNLKIFTKSMDQPVWKNVNFATFLNYLELLVFYLERRQILFSKPIWLKKKGWRNFKFFMKTMDQLLWKNLNFATFLNWCFYSLELLVFYLERRQTLFLSL